MTRSSGRFISAISRRDEKNVYTVHERQAGCLLDRIHLKRLALASSYAVGLAAITCSHLAWPAARLAIDRRVSSPTIMVGLE